MKKEEARAKAMKLLGEKSLKDLMIQWELVSAMPISIEVATVRGWLMDEISRRNPKGFDAFIDSYGDDMDLRKFVLVK